MPENGSERRIFHQFIFKSNSLNSEHITSLESFLEEFEQVNEPLFIPVRKNYKRSLGEG